MSSNKLLFVLFWEYILRPVCFDRGEGLSMEEPSPVVDWYEFFLYARKSSLFMLRTRVRWGDIVPQEKLQQSD